VYANKALVSKLGCKSRDPSLINISRGTRDRIKRGAKRTAAPSFRRGHPRELPVFPVSLSHPNDRPGSRTNHKRTVSGNDGYETVDFRRA